jgi:hypothetical protein
MVKKFLSVSVFPMKGAFPTGLGQFFHRFGGQLGHSGRPLWKARFRWTSPLTTRPGGQVLKNQALGGDNKRREVWPTGRIAAMPCDDRPASERQ